MRQKDGVADLRMSCGSRVLYLNNPRVLLPRIFFNDQGLITSLLHKSESISFLAHKFLSIAAASYLLAMLLATAIIV